MSDNSMSNILQRMKDEATKAGLEGKAALLALVPMLEQHGAKLLVVHYDGQGDSGEVDWIAAFSDEGAAYEDYYVGAEHFPLVMLPELEPDHASKLYEKIDRAACDVLQGLDIDWYNNEGGIGHVILTITPEDKRKGKVMGPVGKITVQHSARVESTVDSEHEV